MNSRRGVALLVVLWIMAILTLLMYAFLAEMQVEYALAAGYADGRKAEQLCWSAIDVAAGRVAADTRTWHGLSDPWADDKDKFFEVPLGEGVFTVFRPGYGDEEKIFWGLDDEASKININVAPPEVLMRLPRMTEAIASAIVDWRDQDSNPLPAGAEDSYYRTRRTPYTCKNQPFESVEELLYVRDVTPEILYGEDANLNGRLDPNENDGDTSWPPDNRNGRLDPGLWSLVTVVSVDKNVGQDGQARININSAAPAQLQAAGFSAVEIQAINATRITQGPFASVAHLLGDPARGLGAVLTQSRFELLADKLSVQDGPVPGLVNINTAPKQVLLALPGISEEIALRIIGYRTPPGSDLSNMGWLLDVIEPAVLQQFAGQITFASYQFRIHAVGRVGTPYDELSRSSSDVPERPGAYRRMVAVFDMLATPRPRLVYWKDLTKLGFPYDPEDGPVPPKGN